MNQEIKKNPSGEPHPRGLGRGLSALIGESGGNRQKTSGSRTLPVAFLSPNRQQPRKRFSEDGLSDLAASIEEKGVLQPILVRPIAGKVDAYEIVAGERRWRAAQIAKLHDVPVVVRELSDSDALEIAIIENVQRADLNAIEEAAAYRELMERFEYTQDKVAKQVGKSRSHIANTMRLLNLPDSVREMVVDGRLSAGHARTLIGSPDAEARALEIIAQALNVREAEKKIAPKKIHSPVRDPDIEAEESNISNMLGLKVQIIHKGDKGGEIRIFYRDLEQFDAITAKLKR